MNRRESIDSTRQHGKYERRCTHKDSNAWVSNFYDQFLVRAEVDFIVRVSVKSIVFTDRVVAVWVYYSDFYFHSSLSISALQKASRKLSKLLIINYDKSILPEMKWTERICFEFKKRNIHMKIFRRDNSSFFWHLTRLM